MFDQIICCFQITLGNKQKILLNSTGAKKIKIEENTYLPYSGLNIVQTEMNNSGLYKVMIHGIFEKNGITRNCPMLESYWNIKWVYNQSIVRDFSFYLDDYFVEELEFIITLQSESFKYKTPLLKNFSQSCRASFGDAQCKLNLENYSTDVVIKNITENKIEITSFNFQNFHFNDRQIFLYPKNKPPLSFVILQQTGNILSLSKDNIQQLAILKEDLINTSAKLVPNSDKSFIMCSRKYKNSINFRGEPFIPEKIPLLDE